MPSTPPAMTDRLVKTSLTPRSTDILPRRAHKVDPPTRDGRMEVPILLTSDGVSVDLPSVHNIIPELHPTDILSSPVSSTSHPTSLLLPTFWYSRDSRDTLAHQKPIHE